MGFSIKGNAVTLIKDCELQITKPLNRQGLRLSSAGIILIGQQLLDESFYSVIESLYLFNEYFTEIVFQ